MNIPDNLRPWFPVKWAENIAAVYAIKALAAGEANAGQQKLALDYIVHVIAQRYAIPYFPDSPTDTAFASGKLFVGEQVLKLIALKGEDIQDAMQPKQLPSKRKS